MPPKRAPAPEIKPPVDFSPSIVLADSASLTGTHRVRIASNTVVHPRAKLNSTLGPITIGRSCIIGERTQLVAPDAQGLTIGDGVVVEVNALVEAREVGEGSTVEVGVRVGKGARVGKHCKLAPLTRVADGEVLEDYTVLYGAGERRMDKSGQEGARRKLLEMHVESLRVLIPSNASKWMS
ncbi:uncharacterized protein H6S33_010018 [Morchella sextelata]|uniref:uncharacterized protein n=1 Tax=Morchella sextelata TaxID=1174677 RepID=UPI001D052BAA|nr:uncharacterized protein H6S33_010018 [Morchella sextelata]KAH0611966.1 hypothetical protein H6S33_010018 [Morchella sextelata]